MERSWWEKLTGQNKPPEVAVPQASVTSVAVPVVAPTSEVKPSERSWWQRLTGQNKPPEVVAPAPAEVAPPVPTTSVVEDKPAERSWWQRLTGQNKPVPAATAESQQMDLPAVNPMNNSPAATSRP